MFVKVLNPQTAASVETWQPFCIAVLSRSDRFDAGDLGVGFLDGLFHALMEADCAHQAWIIRRFSLTNDILGLQFSFT
jgi:hypothetical protein